MHTERQIRQAIRPLLELYGKLNTTEIKKHLGEVLEFDDEDKTPSKTRKEMLIIQRIGNIVAHQSEVTKYYREGFIVDKGTSPATFYAVVGLKKPKKLNQDEIVRRQTKARSQNPKQKKYKKINWEYENERKTVIGTMGEEFIVEYEREKVAGFDKNSVDRVIHLSALQGDGFGYDVASVDEQGNTMFIEVKTTKNSNPDTPFYMSLNEKNFFEEHIDNNTFVYRVYSFNEDNRHGLIQKICAKDLIANYSFDPITFMVHKK